MTHDHDHRYLFPRTAEEETFERLDQLLRTVLVDGSTTARTVELVKDHVASLIANIEIRTVTATRGPLDTSPAGTIRWIELLLGREIDHIIATITNNQPDCIDCQRTWIAYLLKSKDVIAEWSLLREMDAQYNTESNGPTKQGGVPGTTTVRAGPMDGEPGTILSPIECMYLLAHVDVGRIGVSIDALPVIFTVNYALDSSEIVFLAKHGSKLLVAASGNVVAFEAD